MKKQDRSGGLTVPKRLLGDRRLASYEPLSDIENGGCFVLVLAHTAGCATDPEPLLYAAAITFKTLGEKLLALDAMLKTDGFSWFPAKQYLSPGFLLDHPLVRLTLAVAPSVSDPRERLEEAVLSAGLGPLEPGAWTPMGRSSEYVSPALEGFVSSFLAANALESLVPRPCDGPLKPGKPKTV